MNEQLFPKPPRQMKQPSKDALRDQLALAADTIIRECQQAASRRRWWQAVLGLRANGVDQ